MKLFAIKCLTSGKMYVGISRSKKSNYNPCKFLVSQTYKASSNEDPTMNGKELPSNKLLKESVDKYGIKDHVCIQMKKYETDDIDKLNRIRYEMIKNLMEKDICLNDRNINPETYLCDCGMKVRKELQNEHESKYCAEKITELCVNV